MAFPPVAVLALCLPFFRILRLPHTSPRFPSGGRPYPRPHPRSRRAPQVGVRLWPCMWEAARHCRRRLSEA